MEGQARASVKHEAARSATSDQPLQPRRLSASQNDSSKANGSHTTPKPKSRRSRNDASEDSTKRRCISTACVACRKRKSKCDGNTPSCAACASVYGTPCVYEPNSDHRRKGVYKKDSDNLKTRSSTLQTLISAILNYPQHEVPDLVRQIRACESLDKVADAIVARENGDDTGQDVDLSPTSPQADTDALSFERQLYSKVGELRLEDGSVRFIGGTSNLLYDDADEQDDFDDLMPSAYAQSREQIISSWTTVDIAPEAIVHLLNLYFTWHYPFFTVLSQSSFWFDFNRGNTGRPRKTDHCSPLLVNVMLALGCHFSSMPYSRSNSEDSATAGDHFFHEAKRLIDEGDEYGKPRMTTVQALALMSVREAGCGREAKGWVYSGISFRMACDLGINFETEGLIDKESGVDEEEEDVRRVTFWGCFLVDKCWSNYLGRLPLFQASNNITMPKFNVIPEEDAEIWTPYTDSGSLQLHSQPSRIRAVALQLSALCDISGDLMKSFYHPQDRYPSRQAELKRLSEIHTRLEEWRRNLPQEMDAREGSLPNVLVMHMFFQLLHIHLFRPFLKYSPTNSPLPSHVSPRKLCTNAAGTISKLFRLYKRSYGLRQICNIAVYIAHSACTIHLLNLPEKNAARDITHGVRHLEEIADGWLCARRTLRVLSLQARKWHTDLPDDAAQTLARTDGKYGLLGSPKSTSVGIERHSISGKGQTMPSMSVFSGLQLQSPWSGHASDNLLSLPATSTLASVNNTSGPTSQQPSPQGMNLMGLPGGLQGSVGQDQSTGAPQDVNASYLNLLQQQQAWNEAAARNGIPTVSSLGQAGIHQAAPMSSSLFNGSTDKGLKTGFSMSPQQPLQVIDALSLDSGSVLPQPEAQVLFNAPQLSSPNQPHRAGRVGSNASSDQQSFSRRPTFSSVDQDPPLQPPKQQQQQPESVGQPQKRTARKSYGNMFGGVEALLREAQDWWVEDQSQFASGFSNWNMLEGSRRNSAAAAAASAMTATDQGQQQAVGAEHEDANAPLDLRGLSSARGSQSAAAGKGEGGGGGTDEAGWFPA